MITWDLPRNSQRAKSQTTRTRQHLPTRQQRPSGESPKKKFNEDPQTRQLFASADTSVQPTSHKTATHHATPKGSARTHARTQPVGLRWIPDASPSAGSESVATTHEITRSCTLARPVVPQKLTPHLEECHALEISGARHPCATKIRGAHSQPRGAPCPRILKSGSSTQQPLSHGGRRPCGPDSRWMVRLPAPCTRLKTPAAANTSERRSPHRQRPGLTSQMGPALVCPAPWTGGKRPGPASTRPWAGMVHGGGGRESLAVRVRRRQVDGQKTF